MSKTITNMNKDEKRLMLFDMQEHPEKYTDEQVEHLLADEEVKEFLRDLAMARMAGKKATPKKVDVDKAWKEFANSSYRNRMNIAASIVGIIFLSGVALAAVQNGWFKFSTSDKAVENKAATEQTANYAVFQYPWGWIAILACFIFAICVFVPMLVYRIATKESITARLRSID